MGGKTRKNKKLGDAAAPRLLAGGNPQIAKADGDGPVQAYIAAMPGWKHDIGVRLDALIEGAVPGVGKAIKWNTQFYGAEGQGCFLSFHCFTKHIKVGFFRGASLRPLPPVESKQEDVRYLHIHEGDSIDEARLTSWIRQAAALPGWSASGLSSSEPNASTDGGTHPNIDRYVDKEKTWQEELKALRTILLDCALTEEWKWNKPCYMFEGGNVASIARLKNHCWLMFFRGALLKDNDGVLEKPGDNSEAMRVVAFTSVREIAKKKALLKTLVQQAMDLQRAEKKVDFKNRPALPLPEELIQKMDEVPALKTAFFALTPGRQRGYTLHFSAAKQSKTRTSRIEKCMPKMREGRGLQDR
jgi:uncharacterized protein YdeI (YjbR/CyaY-like superfamily)